MAGAPHPPDRVRAAADRGHSIWERPLGACPLAGAILYVATDHGRDPSLGPLTGTQLGTLLLLGVALATFLASYGWRLPRLLARARRGLVLASAATLATLLALELALLAADDAPYAAIEDRGRHVADPECAHVFAPNWSGVLQSREFRVEWRSNAQGIRADRDVGPKPEGLVRVLAVGDSFTAGDQVPLSETWPGVLESELRRALGPERIEVWNAGFPGYGTELEARWLETRAAAFEPDLVVLALTPNDLGENEHPLRTIALDGALVRADRSAWAASRYAHRQRWWCLAGYVERSQLARRVDPRGLYERLRWGRGEVAHAHAYRPPVEPAAARQWELTEGALLRARVASEALGARFAAIAIPFRAQLGELGPGLDAAHFGARLHALGQREGFPVLDLFDAFRAHPAPAELYWSEDAHCTALGYALVGQRTAAFLLERGDELGLAP